MRAQSETFDEIEIERLAREAEQEAARLAEEMAESIPIHEDEEEYTAEDYERNIEFGQLEAARDEHFALLEKLDKEKKIMYPVYEYMVDGLMPLNELHIIAGESGAGKSTWLLQMIDDWQNERPVLGKKSTWYPYVIFVQDRTKAGVFRTLERMKLHPKAFPVQSALEGGNRSLADKIRDFKQANPDVRIIFVEGLHVGLEDSNDYGKTSKAIRELIALCQKKKLTIVATTHMSKENSRRRNSGRGAVLGSSAAPAMSEANILLNKKGVKIKLTAHGRNEAEIVRFYKWGVGEWAGRLVECDGGEATANGSVFEQS